MASNKNTTRKVARPKAEYPAAHIDMPTDAPDVAVDGEWITVNLGAGVGYRFSVPDMVKRHGKATAYAGIGGAVRNILRDAMGAKDSDRADNFRRRVASFHADPTPGAGGSPIDAELRHLRAAVVAARRMKASDAAKADRDAIAKAVGPAVFAVLTDGYRAMMAAVAEADANRDSWEALEEEEADKE